MYVCTYSTDICILLHVYICMSMYILAWMSTIEIQLLLSVNTGLITAYS